MQNRKLKQKSIKGYSRFSELNGEHPLKKILPDMYIEYAARLRKGGKVAYLNYELARKMGLIDPKHPDEMNTDLNKILLNTFGIIIINEFDIENNKKFPKKDILPGKYMATRYLQLQHEDRIGLQSGDGRSIWNGQIEHKGRIWDVSSGGTGATKLSPATTKYNRYFESGDPSISYGCGYAELDEGISTALFSDVMLANEVATEETLAIIEYPNGISINVRAHENLLRPSHFFRYLKQNNVLSLKKLLNYHINLSKGVISDKLRGNQVNQYQKFLENFSETFAKMAATFEAEYIFCWLDWDGDNILMNGGIIDYGSIRQFGLFHSEYRYDDVERFSTNILEQRKKARYTVQCFIQAVDFIQRGVKRPIKNFQRHKILKHFDESFKIEMKRKLLHKQGFNHEQVEYLLEKQAKKVKAFQKAFSYFERAKSSIGPIKIGDGITWDAIYCMRDLMREMPQLYLARSKRLNSEEFIEILKSAYATANDLELTPYKKKMIRAYQKSYHELVDLVSHQFNCSTEQIYLQMTMRSSVINRAERVTGDSVTHIVQQILDLKVRPSGDELYKMIKNFAHSQAFSLETNDNEEMLELKDRSKKLVNKFFEIVTEHREGI